jgi:pantoate--beta-alanine ligase
MSELVHEKPALRAVCDAWRAQGQRIGFVPTMGALHAGHMSLVDAAREHGATRVALSIFVNPTQFGPQEDFAKYPRTLTQDLALCAAKDLDVVYAPSVETLYPAGFQSHVEVDQITQLWEGTARPTHFQGVTTVVAKLLNTVGPCIAAFGRKDYQQWRVIERMARDLDMPVEILGCPILRDQDGLAMSSRNRYLSSSERQRAVAIVTGLRAANAAYRAGERREADLSGVVRAGVEKAFDSIDYVTLADAHSLVPCRERLDGPAVLLVAARIGQTRLIDNTVLGEDTLA